MKLTVILMLVSMHLCAQQTDPPKWKLNRNKIITGSLFFVSGSAKGFNETLQFNYRIFEKTFPGANDQWFDPKKSWRNKYEGGNPDNGANFFLSTSVFVMVTDQYHLNNFIQRAGIVTAIALKFGEDKKPFKHYLLDALFYALCYQAGFSLLYYPFTSRNYK